MPADGQPVIIQELAGPGATLVLGGLDRPEPPLGVPTRQRSFQTWNPGSDEATVHVMGIAEDPIVLRGRFHDDFARVFGQSPEDQIQQARGLLQRLNRCSISWGTTIARFGRVTRVTPRYVRDSDIIYEIVFSVDGSNEPRGVVRPPPAAVAATNLRNALDTAVQRLSQAATIAQAGRAIGGVVL